MEGVERMEEIPRMDGKMEVDLTPEQKAAIQDSLHKPIIVRTKMNGMKEIEEENGGVDVAIPYSYFPYFTTLYNMCLDIGEINESIEVEMAEEHLKSALKIMEALEPGNDLPSKSAMKERKLLKELSEVKEDKNGAQERTLLTLTDDESELIKHFNIDELTFIAGKMDHYGNVYAMHKFGAEIAKRFTKFVDAKKEELIKQGLRGKEHALQMVMAIRAEVFPNEPFDPDHFETEYPNHDWIFKYVGQPLSEA